MEKVEEHLEKTTYYVQDAIGQKDKRKNILAAIEILKKRIQDKETTHEVHCKNLEAFFQAFYKEVQACDLFDYTLPRDRVRDGYEIDVFIYSKKVWVLIKIME